MHIPFVNECPKGYIVGCIGIEISYIPGKKQIKIYYGGLDRFDDSLAAAKARAKRKAKKLIDELSNVQSARIVGHRRDFK